MKIVLSPSGTTGDIRPMVAFAKGLVEHGHRVTMVPPLNGKTLCERAGLETHAFNTDFNAIADDLTKMSAANRTIRNITNAQFEALEKVVPGNDLLIGGSVQFAGQSVAEANDIPFWYANFTIPIIPSAEYPPVICKNQAMPSALNRFWWHVFDFGANAGGAGVVNSHRKRLGLPKLQKHFNSRFENKAIISTDTNLARVPSHTPYEVSQSSYWHLEDPAELSTELNNFLESNCRPKIFLGFGSVPSRHQPKLIESLHELIRNGYAIVYSGSVNSDKMKDQNFIKVSNEPHLKLFPQMQAVVHHGGSGTTHAAAISGIPQIIIPCMMDQFFWGRKIAELGIGLQLSLKKVHSLAKVIEHVTKETDTINRARELSRRLRESRGTIGEDIKSLGL